MLAGQVEEVREQVVPCRQGVPVAVLIGQELRLPVDVPDRRQGVQAETLDPHGLSAHPLAAIVASRRAGGGAQAQRLHVAPVLRLGQQLHQGGRVRQAISHHLRDAAIHEFPAHFWGNQDGFAIVKGRQA